MEPFFEAQDRQADACLHADPFAGHKNMEHEVRNVRSAKSGRGSLPDHKTGKQMGLLIKAGDTTLCIDYFASPDAQRQNSFPSTAGTAYAIAATVSGT